MRVNKRNRTEGFTIILRLILTAFVVFSLSASASEWGTREIPTPLLTGNGFGFGLYSLRDGHLSKFYAHTYRYEKPDPKDYFSEGIETTNVLKSMRWEVPNHEHGQRTGDVIEDSHVIAVRDELGTEIHFMPWGLKRNVLVSIWQSTLDAQLKIEWSRAVVSEKTVRQKHLTAKVFRFENTKESLALVDLGMQARALAYVESGAELNSLMNELDRWSSTGPMVARELEELENWRVQPTFQFHSQDERTVWRRSEVVMRMGQVREQNRTGRYNNGLIVAGLPDGVWVVPWVRDMTYAVRAFIRMGHQEEARQAIAGFFNARPIGRMKEQVGGLPYQIPVVRYFGNGAEETFFTMEGAENIEFDNWGLVLDALTEYVERYNDVRFLRSPTYRGTVYANALKYVVKPLLKNLEVYEDGLIVAADTSIWEERQEDKKHFNYSTAAAIQGLTGFTRLAKRVGDKKTVMQLSEITERLNVGFTKAFIRDNALRGTLEGNFKNEIDSQVLEAIAWGIVTDKKIIDATLKKMELLKVASGGYRRVRGDTEYESHEFILSDINMARVSLLTNQKNSDLIDTIVKKSVSDHGFVPEMYVSRLNNDFKGDIGDPTGAVPLVGYGAGGYILYLTERAAH